MKSILFGAFLLVACGISVATAGDCCERCGCDACCRKVCRLICETKKVPKVTYSCECEDFCVPGPSQRTHDCECGKKHITYTPTCAEVRTRKKLVKHETMKEVPSYRWVVEKVCDACACRDAVEPSALKPADPTSSPSDSATAQLADPIDSRAVAEPRDAIPAAGTPVSFTERIKSQVRRVSVPVFSQE